MSEKTNISWCHVTASPWFGCTEVDECCANCYSREMTKAKFAKLMREAYRLAGFADWETLPLWGDKSPRVLSKGFRENVLKYNRDAAKHGIRLRLFTSLMDWLDPMPAGCVDQFGHRMTMLEFFSDYLHLIFETPHLDHLTLTKRPENWRVSLESTYRHYALAGSINDAFCAWIENWLEGQPPNNVWFGYTAGTTRSWIERYQIAKHIPAKVRWCSAEPLLHQLFVSDILEDPQVCGSNYLDWLVIGGESGPKRRDCGVQPIIELAQNAQLCGIKVFVKQDCALRPGQQGRIPPEVWAMKNFPAPGPNGRSGETDVRLQDKNYHSTESPAGSLEPNRAGKFFYDKQNRYLSPKRLRRYLLPGDRKKVPARR